MDKLDRKLVPAPPMPAPAVLDDGFIKSRIFTIRGVQVVLDRDLAELYGVATKALNQAVRRNANRFPEEFMFALSKDETDELVTKCDRFLNMRELPRPLPRHRRPGAVPDRRLPQGPRQEMLRLHEDGPLGNRRTQGENVDSAVAGSPPRHTTALCATRAGVLATRSPPKVKHENVAQLLHSPSPELW